MVSLTLWEYDGTGPPQKKCMHTCTHILSLIIQGSVQTFWSTGSQASRSQQRALLGSVNTGPSSEPSLVLLLLSSLRPATSLPQWAHYLFSGGDSGPWPPHLDGPLGGEGKWLTQSYHESAYKPRLERGIQAPRPIFRPLGRAASYSGVWTYAGYGHGQRLCTALGAKR